MGLRGPKESTLGFYKLHESVQIPIYATTYSACFDLRYFPGHHRTVNVWNEFNSPKIREVPLDGKITIGARERLVCPTSLIFDIGLGCSVRLHPRSGLALKSGIILANCEGVIDADYNEEVMVILYNISHLAFDIMPGDRICQGELVRKLGYTTHMLTERPLNKSEREGGMGSTGINDVKNNT
jgi:dUTP pyrophosphatase